MLECERWGLRFHLVPPPILCIILYREWIWANYHETRTTTSNSRVSFTDFYLVFPTNFKIVFLPHKKHCNLNGFVPSLRKHPFLLALRRWGRFRRLIRTIKEPGLPKVFHCCLYYKIQFFMRAALILVPFSVIMLYLFEKICHCKSVKCRIE